METKVVECPQHGVQPFGLMCVHLAASNNSIALGFYEHDEGDLGRPDAWCSACEDRWQTAESEEEQEQWFVDCDFKIVCANCWDTSRKQNIG